MQPGRVVGKDADMYASGATSRTGMLVLWTLEQGLGG